MNLFYRKPFELACTFFLLSCVTAHFFARRISLAILFSAIAVLILCFFLLKNRRFQILLILLPMILGFGEQLMYRRHIEKDILSYASSDASEVELLVLKRLYSYDYDSGFEVRCKSIDGEPTNFKMIFTSEFHSDVQEGFYIRTNAFISEFENDGSFDEKSYYNNRGFYLRAIEESKTYTVLDENASDIGLAIRRLNRLVGDVFSNFMDGEAASLYRAVFLGDKDSLGENIKRDFRRTGTYHLLALSGMHLAVVSRYLEEILKHLHSKKSVRYAVLPAFIALYCIFTGMSPSVIRSALMIGASYLAFFMRARKDRLTSLCFAVSAICIFSPSSVTDIGLWLSFFAAFGLFLFDCYKSYLFLMLKNIKNTKLRKFVRRFIGDFFMSVSAIFMTLPFTWVVFGKISWIGPLASVILTPIISFMLYLSPIFLVFSVTLFADIIAFIPEKLAKAALFIVGSFSDIRGVYVSVKYSFVPYLLMPFLVVFALLLIVRLKHKMIIPISVLVFLVVFSVSEIAVINKSTSDLSYIHTDNNEYLSLSDKGHHILIDISDGAYSKLYSAALDTVEYGFDEFDVLILTHLHQKHVSAVSKLACKEKIYEVLIPSPINDEERTVARAVADAAESAGAKVTVYKTGGEITLFGKTSFINDRGYISRSTHPINRLTFDGLFSALYVGSSYFEFDANFAPSENIMIGTHGPVCKNEYVLPITYGTSLVSIADEELLAFAVSDSSFENIHLMKNTKKLTLRKEY